MLALRIKTGVPAWAARIAPGSAVRATTARTSMTASRTAVTATSARSASAAEAAEEHCRTDIEYFKLGHLPLLFLHLFHLLDQI